MYLTKKSEWTVNTELSKKWCNIFTTLSSLNIAFRNILNIVEFVLAIPGTNAAVERLFSVMSSVWTDEKNRFHVDSIKSIIIVKTHFKDISCTEFHDLLIQNPKILNHIQSSEKYSRTDMSEIDQPSTSF